MTRYAIALWRLSAYHFSVGEIQAGDELLPNPENLQPFTKFCDQVWNKSISLVKEARRKQQL